MSSQENTQGKCERGTERNGLAGAAGHLRTDPIATGTPAAELARFPEGVRASVGTTRGEYDARRLRSQLEIIRDVMLSAAECETWLTLAELRALTRYGEASISAQLRNLRKTEHGGYELTKRRRDGAPEERRPGDRRGELVWEYRLGRGSSGCEDCAANAVRMDAVA
jgi:hypothetical protein